MLLPPSRLQNLINQEGRHRYFKKKTAVSFKWYRYVLMLGSFLPIDITADIDDVDTYRIMPRSDSGRLHRCLIRKDAHFLAIWQWATHLLGKATIITCISSWYPQTRRFSTNSSPPLLSIMGGSSKNTATGAGNTRRCDAQASATSESLQARSRGVP